MPLGAIQAQLTVGQVVLVPCVITALTEGTQPTVTLTTVYKGFDGNTDVVGVLDAIQVKISQ